MAETKPQSFANHAKFVPLYHFVLLPLLLLNLGAAIWLLYKDPGLPSAVLLLTAAGLFLTAFYARVFPLGAQDRVIRLEERLRMADLLPEDLRHRIDELSACQMVALRFASDGELAELVRQVLDEGITNRTEIKKRIKTWRPDHCRL
ncbi:MAG: hypothetical protein D6696_05415 [Acidobacteria bacterium]|nr:MAG: hypothetical protein D6696_05415 [Acidobacteriota bacterium]